MAGRAADFAAVAVNRFLGFELRACDERGATVAFRPKPDHAQEYGVVHGGLLSALADTAAVYAVHPALPASTRMTSIEFKINFLAAALPANGELLARSKLVKKGRTVAVVAVDVEQSGTAIATGLFTYILLPAPPEQ